MSIIQNPKVSIAIPTYNRSLYLKQAIDSALYQSYKNVEIIVSNNGSTDNTAEILLNYHDERLRVVNHKENNGMVFNFNHCLNTATGEFFLLLSDDDVLENYAIEKLLAGFINDTISISYGRVAFIGNGETNQNHYSFDAPQIETGYELLRNILECKRVAFPSATMFRTIIAKNLGGYPDVGTSTDFALLSLLAINNSVFFISQPITKYRIHEQALSLSEDAIFSQITLLKWINSSAALNCVLKEPMNNYSKNFIYNWGKHQALIGNKKKSALAESSLNLISPNKKWRWIFLILNFKPLRWLAAFKRNLFQPTYKH